MNDENMNDNWTPDSEKYNTPQQPQKKKSSKWWIPVSAIMAVLLAGVIVTGVFLIRSLNTSQTSAKEVWTVGSESATEQATESTEPRQIETAAAAENKGSGNESSGIYLTDVSEIVDQVMPAVVSVTSRTIVNNNSYGSYWGYFFGGGQSSSGSSGTEVDSGLGSGTIVGQNDEEILILTSYHVVDDCSSLYVTFCDDESVDGYIKGTIEDKDIAVVAVRKSDVLDETLDALAIATLCQEDVSVGDGLIVIGNALGYGQSVSTGIVSAKGREITVETGQNITVIQTNAAINNGNSGGCALNADGEIVGISEAKISNSAVEGMCYAISVYTYYDQIEDILNQPAEAQEEKSEGSSSTDPGYIGIYGRDIDSSLASQYHMPEGIYVQSTISGSGAEKAGLTQGDIVYAFNGTSTLTMDELKLELAKYNAGDTITLSIYRYQGAGYAEIDVEVTLTSQIS